MAPLDTWPSEQREFRDPVTGTRVLQLTAHPADHLPLTNADSSFTPRGDTLLFLSTRDRGHWNLFRMDLSTGELSQVTETDCLDPHSLTAAADGRRAVASLVGEAAEIAAVELESGEWETLAVFPEARVDDCHLSASGEYVVTVVTREEQAALVAVHTEGMRTVPILEELETAASPRFSPDSRNSVLYVGAAPPAPPGARATSRALRCVEFDGSNDRLLYPSPDSLVPGRAPVAAASWLGTGDEVIFVAGPDRGPLMAAPRQGGRLRTIAEAPCLWARSNPVGDRIVAVLASPDIPTCAGGDLSLPVHQLTLLDPHNGQALALCSGRTGWVQPAFSPDGRSILYADRDERGHFHLYLVLLDQ
jgi:dipeptidyl aminopeptidase/acylaminoacyl peptidase